MVEPEIFFHYLRRSFLKHVVIGYGINKKVNNRTCIYMEDGKWVVARIKKGSAIDEKRYDIDDIWSACEDMIKRLSRSVNHHKKVWMDWASPSNWAEKMDEPLKIRIISSPDDTDHVVASSPEEGT